MKTNDDARFQRAALSLFSHAALILHWRPDDFWSATPAELAAIFMPPADQSGGPDLAALMKEFPDGPDRKRDE